MPVSYSRTRTWSKSRPIWLERLALERVAVEAVHGGEVGDPPACQPSGKRPSRPAHPQMRRNRDTVRNAQELLDLRLHRNQHDLVGRGLRAALAAERNGSVR